MKQRFLVIICLAFVNISVMFAQPTIELSSKSAKAKEYYKEATKFYDMYNNIKAEEALNRAIKEDPKFIEAYLLLGSVLFDQKKYGESIDAYKKSIEIKPDFFPNTYHTMGKIELGIGRYEDAKKSFEKFLTYPNITQSMKIASDRMIARAEFGINAIKDPVEFNPINLGDSINTIDYEYSPTITADEQTLIITKRRPRDAQTIDQKLSEEEDFFISYKYENYWSKAIELGAPINTNGNEGAQSISPDGSYIIFTACNRPDGFGSCDLYFSVRNGDSWSKPVNLGSKVNSKLWESQPSIAPDGKTFYFASNRAGTKGHMDIWKSELQEDGMWGTPINLGDTINTPYQEANPFIHPDNQTLYFSSNGHMGMGNLDIFYSRKNKSGRWDSVINIGYPINTFADENSLIVNLSGTTAYFASEREGGKGKLDLYSFNLYEEARPKKVTYLKGRVYDAKSHVNLEARFELFNLSTGELIAQSYSDPKTGEFLVCIPTGNEYGLNVSKNAYLFYSDNFTMTGEASFIKPFLKDIPLKPILSGETVVLHNIFFETAKWELKPESLLELDRLIKLLNQNPELKIEVSGHTDNIGAKAYNLDLSEKRAKSVCDYLISKGVIASRLSFKGYGDTKPIDVNTTEEGRARNRRTEFKVL